jgi:hypothetical protein
LEKQLGHLEKQVEGLRDDRDKLMNNVGTTWKVSLSVENAKKSNSIRRWVYYYAGSLTAMFPISQNQTHRDFIKYQGETLLVELWFSNEKEAKQFVGEIRHACDTKRISRSNPSTKVKDITHRMNLASPIDVILQSNYVPADEPDSGGKDTMSVHSIVSTAAVDSDFRKYQSIETGIEFKRMEFQKAHLIHRGKCIEINHPTRETEKIRIEDESNMISLSMDMHKNFDGNQSAVSMLTAPSFLIKLGKDTRDVDISTNRFRVNLIVQFSEDLDEGDYTRFKSMLMKNGATPVDSEKKIYTFVHVVDKELFKFGIEWKQKETQTLWDKLQKEQMDLYNRQ